MFRPVLWMLLGMPITVAIGAAYINLVSPTALDAILRKRGGDRRTPDS